MRWRLPAGLATLLTLGALAVVILATNTGGSGEADPTSPAPAAAHPPRIPRGTLIARVGDQAVGRPIPSGFVGFSFEFQAVRAYTGLDPASVNPVLIALIRNLTSGQAPVLRIGGDSTDASYPSWVKPPPYTGYKLTPGWMATTGALARAVRARMILGLNLAANKPYVAAAELRAYLKVFGPRAIEALEIGNEPNVYAHVTTFRTPSGGKLRARAPGYDYPQFAGEFGAIARTTGSLPLAGPALAAGPSAGEGSWINSIPSFLNTYRRVQAVTVHRYPLRNCFVAPSSPQYPTIAHLLSSYATSGLAHSVKPWLRVAHAHHRQLRLDELNSVACRGKKGVSDTFASSLWVVNALFGLARLGVDGVNMHTLPRSSYELFEFTRRAGRWRAWVRPVYYGLQLFAQAAPPGARLLKAGGIRPRMRVSVWATRARDGRLRVALVNESRFRGRLVAVKVPPATPGRVSIERMQAPSVSATGGVSLGGRSYGRETSTGALPPLRTTAASGGAGTYVVKLPRASAALLTFGT
jgi:hypothetical protein